MFTQKAVQMLEWISKHHVEHHITSSSFWSSSVIYTHKKSLQGHKFMAILAKNTLKKLITPPLIGWQEKHYANIVQTKP